MSDLEARRRLYAEEIQLAANLKSATVVAALASVERERFLPPGPWTIRGEGDMHGTLRQTPDAEPRHVYHNVAIAIDPARMLFNGAPSVVAMAIDALALAPGDRVLHIGAGLGYYTALAAHCVGSSGRVVGIEVDAGLAASARANLRGLPWVDVREGDGSEAIDGPFDAILVSAGVTHPLPSWLDALAPRGRMMAPITATMPAMKTISKGPMMLFTRGGDGNRLEARVTGFVAIYTALGVRDDAIDSQLGQAMGRAPFAAVRWLRRDPHEREVSCWLHTPGFCLALGPAS